MILKSRGLLLCFGVILALLPRTTWACGCGLGLADADVLAGLKEPQAYMVLNVQNATAYSADVFFKLFSLNDPETVTIVFPMRDIPTDVTAEPMSAQNFSDTTGITTAKYHGEYQSLTQFVQEVSWNTLKWSLSPAGVFLYNAAMSTVTGASPGELGSSSLVKHFSFDGGTLDIHDLQSGQTLEDFVAELDIDLTDEVTAVVQKYSTYYIAVLRLDIPSVVSEQDLALLKQCLPEGLTRVQDELASGKVYTRQDIDTLVNKEAANSSCEPTQKNLLKQYIAAATDTFDQTKGTALHMEFENTDTVFYPTSLVDTYRYPISDEQYYITMPQTLDVTLDSAKVTNAANVDTNRWYTVKANHEDISGVIVQASFFTKFQDWLRQTVEFYYGDEELFGLILAFMLACLTSTLFVRKTWLSWLGTVGSIVVVWPLFGIGGVILVVLIRMIYRRIKHKKMADHS